MSSPEPSDHERVTRYLLGELGPDADLTLETEAESSPELARELDEGRFLLTAIRADNPALNHVDIRAKLRPLTREPSTLRTASLVPHLISLLLLTVILALSTSHAPSPAAVTAPQSSSRTTTTTTMESSRIWLAATQDLNGHWNPGQWGGQERYKVAVTALALMALQNPSPAHPIEPGMEARAKRASQWLWSSLDHNGCFGGDGPGAAFNHALATLALLERRDGADSKGLEKALELIRASQNRDGGWGRYGEGGSSSVSAITAWQVKALETALALGRATPELDRALRKGRAWLEQSGTHTDPTSWGNSGGPAHRAGGSVLAAATESLSQSSPSRSRAISVLLASRGS